MRSSLLAVGFAAVLAACGPGSTSSPPPPPGGGDGGTGGGTSGGGAGGGSGGQPSGGSGAPSGGPAQPSGGDQGGTSGGGGSTTGGGTAAGDSGSGGGSTAGGGAPSGGGSGGGRATGGGGSGGGMSPPGPVASHDGTVSIERLDADPECDGLLPASAPDAVSVRLSSGSCSGTGTSDGTGHVAVQTGGEVTGEYSGAWVERQAFTPDGQPEGVFSLRSVGTPALLDGTPALAEPRGWLGLRAWGRATFTPVEVHLIAPDGSDARTERIDGPNLVHEVGIAEDPLGGALVWQHWHADPTTPTGCAGGAQRFDASGAPRGPVARLGGCFGVGAAVSRAGEALVLEQGTAGAPVVEWIGADGTPARPPVADPTLAGVTRARMAPLLDGTIAVDVGSGWTRRYPHLADRSEPAPGWLASAPPRFRNTRGNRGYAFFAGALRGAPPASAGCSQRIELRAPSGRLCGAVTLENPGGACTPGLADQGWDGTVVERNAREPCAWRWWPRLLGE